MNKKIDIKTVEELAHLARLEFDEAGKERMLEGMNNMLKFVNKLEELDTTSVEPLIYLTDGFAEAGVDKTILRNDVVHQKLKLKDAMQNAPSRDSDFFKTPKVIDKPS